MNVSQVTNDILNNPRFEGAIDSISWLTDWIDVGFGMAITLVAFLIILVAMFKNVLAAAYCAYPKFWESVAKAHEDKRSNQNTNVFTQMIDMFQGVGSSRGGSINGGTIGTIILGIIPDIKSMTDFEDNTISAKSYFMKAIPQMLVCVILGAFIYNGTYRDVAARVVDFGSTMVSRTLLSFDPIAAFDDFTGSSGRPVFSTDGATGTRDQRINQLATNMYTAVIGTYKDITTAEQKRVLADNCEIYATSVMSQIQSHGETSGWTQGFVDSSEWSMSLNMNWSSAARDTTAMIGIAGTNPTVYQYAVCIALDDVGIPSSEVHDSYTYLVAVMQFQQGQSQSSGAGYNDLVMVVNSTSAQQFNIGTASGASVYFNSNPGTITFSDGTGSGTLVFSSSARTLDVQPGSALTNGTTYPLAKPIVLYAKGTDGATYSYTITHVKYDTSGTTGALSSSTGDQFGASTYPNSIFSNAKVATPNKNAG